MQNCWDCYYHKHRTLSTPNFEGVVYLICCIDKHYPVLREDNCVACEDFKYKYSPEKYAKKYNLR